MKESRPSIHRMGLLQWKGQRTLEAFLDPILKKHRLSHSEWKLLGIVFDAGELQAREIATLLDVKAPLVTRILAVLLRKKLLRIEAHDRDRRIKCINITAAGERSLGNMEGDVRKMLDALFSGLSPEHIRNYKEVMGAIIENGLVLGKKPD